MTTAEIPRFSPPFDATETATVLQTSGVALLSAVFSADEMAVLGTELDESLRRGDERQSVRSRSGRLFAARNLLDLFPASRQLWQRPPLTDILPAVLGGEYGLVRGLFFDKPPERGWSLAWHQDRMIAVRDDAALGSRFTHPTRKAGVAHVEAPAELLERMLTLRLHLDPMTADNGPLLVMPRSHQPEREPSQEAIGMPVYGASGDVFLMRPLIWHASRDSRAGCELRRRVLHLEFAAAADLLPGGAWQWFVRPEW